MLFVEQACEKVWGMRFPDSGEVTVNLGSERKDEGENGQVVVLADGGEESGLFCQNSVSNFRAGRLIIATLHWRTFTVLFTFSFLF